MRPSPKLAAAGIARAIWRFGTAPRLGFGRIVASENNRGADYLTESDMKWMSGGTKPQCDRALVAPHRRGGAQADERRPRVVLDGVAGHKRREPGAIT